MDVERRGLVLSQLAESMWDGKELSGGERSAGGRDGLWGSVGGRGTPAGATAVN